MKTLFKQIIQTLETGHNAILITFIANSGTSYRGARSRMLVQDDGSVIGTVRNEEVKSQCIQKALEILRKKTCTQGFTLTQDQIYDMGAICGGNIDAYFQYMDSQNQDMLLLCYDILNALDRNENSWLILDVSNHICWQMGLYNEKSGMIGMVVDEQIIDSLRGHQAYLKTLNHRNYYLEPLVQSGYVYIFGGGDVAQALVPVLDYVGFRCIVMDEDETFANCHLFPKAVKTIVGDLQNICHDVNIETQDYVCIMTRGHRYDYSLQKQVLPYHPRYIGIIGNHKKIQINTQKLLDEGFKLEDIEACHMPIGLSICAMTPEEIAISIAGELILERSKKQVL